MPRGRKGGAGRRKATKGKGKATAAAAAPSSALVLPSDGSLSTQHAELLRQRIDQLTKSKMREDSRELLATKNGLKTKVESLRSRFCEMEDGSDKSALIESCFEELATFTRGINDIFYDMHSNESCLKAECSRVVEANSTLEQLCRTLRVENVTMKERMEETRQKEKHWQTTVEAKLQTSIGDIKSQIAAHEEKYKAIDDENAALRQKLSKLIEFEKKRTADFEKLQKQQKEVDQMNKDERQRLVDLLTTCRTSAQGLGAELQKSVRHGGLLQARCQQYESKIETLSAMSTESAACIDQFKAVKEHIVDQNEKLHKQLRQVMSKYKSLNAYNDLLSQNCDKHKSQNETLTALCRRLQQKNHQLTDSLKDLRRSYGVKEDTDTTSASVVIKEGVGHGGADDGADEGAADGQRVDDGDDHGDGGDDKQQPPDDERSGDVNAVDTVEHVGDGDSDEAVSRTQQVDDDSVVREGAEERGDAEEVDVASSLLRTAVPMPAVVTELVEASSSVLDENETDGSKQQAAAGSSQLTEALSVETDAGKAVPSARPLIGPESDTPPPMADSSVAFQA